ncbi:transposase, partial [Crocosphaera sp. Alani8]|uniref:transposase n=1 Tax=Crocosphaera sp. Alani8 TaxID=3038952 RepID=UPI00313B61D7
MKKSSEKLPFNFKVKKPLEVNFSGLDLTSDAGLLLVKQAEGNLKVAQGISTCLEDNREQHKVKHSLSWCAFPCALQRRGVAPLFQLVSQRIYQIAAGYEDTNDSNYLRHDPIFKIICDKIPEMGAELLAS